MTILGLSSNVLSDKSDGIRQRKKENSDDVTESAKSEDVPSKQLTFQIEETGSVATDFAKDGGFQKCVRFSPDFKRLVTGGADGHLRMWKVRCLYRSIKIYVNI